MNWLEGYITISRAHVGPGRWELIENQVNAGLWGLLTANGIGVEAKGRGLEFPSFGARHESLRVRRMDGKTLLVSSRPGKLNVRDSRIWFAASCFGDKLPDFIELKADKQSHFWRRVEPDGSTPDKHRPRLSRGLLYEYDGTSRTGGVYEVPFEVQRGDATAGEALACLNPLIVRYNPGEGIKGEATDSLKQMWAHFRQEEQLLDVSPCFTGAAGLYGQWCEKLAKRWEKREGEWPAVPSLVLGAEWDPGFVPFMMLDQLGGRFVIDGLASDRATTRTWEQPVQGLPDHWEWLAGWCRSRMKLDPAKDAPDATVPKPSFAGQVDAYTTAVNTAPDATGSQVQAVATNPAARWLAEVEARLPQEEREYLGRLITSSMLSTDRSLVALARERLMPRSPLCVYLPDAPKLMQDSLHEAYADWEGFRQRMLVDLTYTPVRAEVWWLDVIWSGAEARPSPSPRWLANDASWWYRFYMSLFWEPAGFMPTWDLISNDLLGAATLGTMILGGEGRSQMASVTDFALN